VDLLTPLVADPRAPLARANPVAKLAAAVVLLAALFVSLDGVTSTVVLVGIAAAASLSGLRLEALVRRSWLIAVAAASVVVVNIAFAEQQQGPTLIAVGPVVIGSQTALDALGLGVRLLAIALAGVLAVATTEPTDLADSFVQQLRASPRFAVGALAAVRLLPLLAVERQTIAMARRARGVEARGSPIRWLTLAGATLLALLVAAVRRGSRMAVAMEARGLGSKPCRSVARVQRIGPGDWAWIAGAAVLGAAAIMASVALGTWRPLLG
jgi:energy-coupling factor transport system permease protein